jgi:membrane-associated protein
MDLIHTLLDFIHNLGDYQFWGQIFSQYGTLTFIFLFIIIFAETGLVIAPFLPGDSLLFAAGMATALGGLNVLVLLLLLIVAAFIGNTVNYYIGRYIGPAILEREKIPFIKKKHLVSTHAYYEKKGAFAIILGRFIPFVRTFVPFVAGIGKMDQKKYLLYTAIGAVLWVTPFLLVGYSLGSNEWVKIHFHQISLSIVFITVLPFLWGIAKEFFGKKNTES